MGDENNKKKIDEMIEKALEEIEKSEQKAVSVVFTTQYFHFGRFCSMEYCYLSCVGVINCESSTADCTSFFLFLENTR